MRNIQARRTHLSISFLTAFMLVLLAGCGGREISSTGTGTTAASTTSTAAAILLTSSATTVKSDGTSSVTITATVLSSSNAITADQALTFSASTGQLSAATATTDATGKASFTFSAGTSGLNRTATITASATGSTVTATTVIQITGSTLTPSSTTSNAAAGTAIAVSVVAKDAGGNVMPSQPLRYSIAATSTGSATLSASTGTTNASGVATVNVTGTAAGTVDLLTEWLDSSGSVTASATKSLLITAAGGAFSVITPAASPFAVSIGTPQSVVVNVPSTVSSIRYATTLGTWQANNLSVLTVPNGGATNSQTFVPGTNAGNATIQIDAINAAGGVTSSATLIFSITSPSSNANSISLQSNVSVLSPSAGATLSTATLTAIVRDASSNPVGGAPILFELVNSTGTGETISPVIVSTNSTSPMGEAQTTFTAGTSTTQNSSVKATVVGTTITASKQITVGGTVGSIAIGTSTTMTAVNSDTAYQLPVTILVSDSNGNAVSGAVVSLSLWPTIYRKGTRDANCLPIVTSSHINEDRNENLVLNTEIPSEDSDGPGGIPDGALWPPQAAAGSIPATVTTDASGLATFNWIYLKQYANWIKARIRATTQVQGSQSTATTLIDLVPLAADVSTTCPLPPSPFN